jgi:hypothetical protein
MRELEAPVIAAMNAAFTFAVRSASRDQARTLKRVASGRQKIPIMMIEIDGAARDAGSILSEWRSLQTCKNLAYLK